jgi:hypothetical protein
MLSSASERLTGTRAIRERTSRAALALLVQASFVPMDTWSRPVAWMSAFGAKWTLGGPG